MHQLITITKQNINNEEINSVSARELYAYLGVETRFNDWFARMCEYGFTENTDYLAVTQKRVTAQGNETTYTDYIISLSMAKELAMIQRTDKGKQARLYFIECEKQLQKQNTPQFQIPKTYAAALLEAGRLAVELEKAEQQLEEQKPKVEFATQLLQATNGIDFGTSAKAMNLPFGRNKLFEICRKEGWLFGKNQPKQHLVDSGYFVVLESSFIHPTTGDVCVTTKTLITPRGQKWLLKQFKKLGILGNKEVDNKNLDN